jgi:aminoglycoside phosphotransferase (APT) family kinase protein
MGDDDVLDSDVRERLTAWFRSQLPDAQDVRIEGLDRIDFGFSAEMMVLTLVSRVDGADHRQDVVLRLRPPSPGLLEPYDLKRQFDILRALEHTPVRVPRALWLAETDEVLGRPFFVMERVDGAVYELTVPAELDADPERIPQMCRSMAEQLAAIHLVDLAVTGLDALGDGRTYLDRELSHWTGEIHRVQRGPLPGLERLAQALRDSQPEPCPAITLVHGDAKPGNFAFVDDRVNAVFDWEMAGIGDPLADIGWMELLWMQPVGITSRPSSPTVDQFIAHYEAISGITVRNRSWYRAFQAFKMAAILLVGSMLVDGGFSDDLRHAQNAAGISMLTQLALYELGVEGEFETGPVEPRPGRVEALR